MSGNNGRESVGKSGSLTRGIPLTQVLALDRRNALNAQQRTFQARSGQLRSGPSRPPG